MLNKSTAIFAVRDVQETCDFYVRTLGFKVNWLWETPPTFGCVGLGKVEIYLCQQPELAGRIEGHMHIFDVEDVAALYAQHQASGAAIISPLENKPWGVYEYTVRDCNGYHLRFAGPEKYEKPKTAMETLPAHIALSVGLPTMAEFVSLFRSVNWGVEEIAMRAALEHSMFGIVARDGRTNEIVGMTRVTGDGKSFMIWDVIVRPEHQGQRIGTALLEAALAELRGRKVHAGAFVGLFTGKAEFYERLGFKRDGGMHLAL